MKPLHVIALLLTLATTTFAQVSNENTFSVQIYGTDYKTQPRRIRIGNFWWITANSVKPDQSIRIWLGSYDRKDIVEPGTYLIVDEDKPDAGEKRKAAERTSTYTGIAFVKYVVETKEPRMEYHVGKSQNGTETITVKVGSDGFLEASFDCTLAGTYWKEKGTATVFGGMGRLVGKMQDKVITKTTGYDSDIDPEGRGYKKQDNTDTIKLSNGKFRVKLN
jgi:hypothetical protein